jgi:hypothetical protein
MIMNLKTAKALGLEVPLSIRLRGRGDRINRCAPSPAPTAAWADTLAEAKAAFRAAWPRPLSEEERT